MLEEVQDNTGPTSGDGVVDATVTTDLLIDAITAAGGPVDPVTGESFYRYVDIDPQEGKDGGEPGGNIRVGFLFRTDRGLSFVDKPGGTATNEVAVDTTGPDRAASVVQPGTHPGRYDRSDLPAGQGLGRDPQAAGRGVHLQRAHALRHRQPLDLQAGR